MQHIRTYPVVAVLLSAYLCLLAVSFAVPVTAQPLSCPPSRYSVVDLDDDTTICIGACLHLKPQKLNSDLRSTKSYALGTIQYHPYDFTSGVQVLNHQDDVWSEAINLPFDFCFFGQRYRQCVIGANGNITFDASQAKALQSFHIYTSPYNGACYNNCIMGAYYDMDPSKGGEIRYATYGTAPCRTFVVSWNNIPLYNCNWLTGTQQVVLYESTYAIEVFLHQKPVCIGWEHGNGVLGIQNADASAAYIFPGKNCTAWSDTDGGYRFTPSALPDVSYRWYNMRSGSMVSTAGEIDVCPADSTTYLLQATFVSQCDIITVSDTTRINVQKIHSDPNFDFELHYGCKADTVVFINRSTFAGLADSNQQFLWEFGDGTTDTSRNPVHLYFSQGNFYVRLTTKGPGVCEQTTERQVGVKHLLLAGFTVSNDSFCNTATVAFTDTSQATLLFGQWPKLKWVFDDGQQDSVNQDPVHHFNGPGTYEVLQIISNGIPCYDTSRHLIVVDSIPFVHLQISDTALCVGEQCSMQGTYMQNGFRALQWDYGDASGDKNTPAVHHSYERAGYYTITLTGLYNICPDASASALIHVKPYPVVNLGPDTPLCPGSAVIELADNRNRDGEHCTRLWNTGDTGRSISVIHPGIFTLGVTTDGCAAQDTIIVYRSCFIDVPNAFSPNGDGENDYFIPLEVQSKGVSSYRMHIFNRWGQLIYESTSNTSRGWDGVYNGIAQPMGVYVFTLDLAFINGVHEYYQGNLTLIR